MGDIHGARVTPGGVVLDSIVISSDTTVKASPSVVYGNGVYLVSWTDNRVEFPDIYCARVLPNGTVLDGDGFPVHSDSAYQAGSNVSFDGTNFFVAWSSYVGGEFSLNGARVSSAGMVIDSTPIIISQGSSSKFGPGLAFDGTNYMLLWDDCRLNPPEYDQWAARVTPQGMLLDTNGIPVDTSSGNQYNNALSFLDHLYFACWTDFSTGEVDIYGRRISTEGEWIDTVAVTVCNETGHQETPFVFHDDGKFIVSWKDTRNGFLNADLYATFIDSGTVGLEEVTGDRNRKPAFSLFVNPNPFTENVNIILGVSGSERTGGNIELAIFDISGREVREFSLPTAYSLLPTVITWDGCDGQGEGVPPGIYFFVLRDSTGSVTEKVLKIR